MYQFLLNEDYLACGNVENLMKEPTSADVAHQKLYQNLRVAMTPPQLKLSVH